jgi:hypothetical protein
LDQPTATIVASLVSALFVGGAASLTNAIVSSNNRGKTEGIITESLKGITDRMDHREAETERKFQVVEKEQDQQWREINRHTSDIGYLQGKLNGKTH